MGFGPKAAIRKLQGYLNIHVGIINMLLMEHGLEKMNLAADRARVENPQIRERLDSTRNILECIKGSVIAQV
jgi:hypothetical protein